MYIHIYTSLIYTMVEKKYIYLFSPLALVWLLELHVPRRRVIYDMPNENERANCGMFQGFTAQPVIPYFLISLYKQ